MLTYPSDAIDIEGSSGCFHLRRIKPVFCAMQNRQSNDGGVEGEGFHCLTLGTWGEK